MKITIPFIRQNSTETEMWQKAYANDKSTNSGVYPISNRGVWHTGIHLKKGNNDSCFIKPMVLGEIIAYRLIWDYYYFPLQDKGDINETTGDIIQKLEKAKTNRNEACRNCLVSLGIKKSDDTTEITSTEINAAAKKLKSDALRLDSTQWDTVSNILRPHSNAFVLTKHTLKWKDKSIDYFILYNNLAPLSEYKPEDKIYKYFFREWKLDYSTIRTGNIAKVNLYDNSGLTGSPFRYLDTEGKYDVFQESSEYANGNKKNIYRIILPNSNTVLYCSIPNESKFINLLKNKTNYETYYKLIKPNTIESLTVCYDKERKYPKLKINPTAYPVRVGKSIKFSKTYSDSSDITELIKNTASTMENQKNMIYLDFQKSDQYTYSDFVTQNNCFIFYRWNTLTYTTKNGKKYINKIPETLLIYEKKADVTMSLSQGTSIYVEQIEGFGLIVSFNKNSINNAVTMDDVYVLSGKNITDLPILTTANQYTIATGISFTFQKYSVRKWTNHSGESLAVKLFLDDIITFNANDLKGNTNSNAFCVMKFSRTGTGGNIDGAGHMGFIGEKTTSAISIFSKHDFVELKFPSVANLLNSYPDTETKLTRQEGFYLYSDHKHSVADTLKRTVFTSQIDVGNIVLLDQKKTTYQYKQAQLILSNNGEKLYGAVDCTTNADYFTTPMQKINGTDIAFDTIYINIPNDSSHFEYLGKQCNEGDSDVHIELFLPDTDDLPQDIKKQFSILNTKSLHFDKSALNDKMKTIPSEHSLYFDSATSNPDMYSSSEVFSNLIYARPSAYSVLNTLVIHGFSFWEHKELNQIIPKDYGYSPLIADNDERYRNHIQKNLCITQAVRNKMGVGSKKDYYFFHPIRFLEKVAIVLDPTFNPYEGNTIIQGFNYYILKDNPGFAPVGNEDDYFYNHTDGRKKFAKITGGFDENYINLDIYFYTYTKFYHEGVDFSASEGTNIMCFINGTIKAIGKMKGYGKTMLIKDNNKNILYLLAHLSDKGKKSDGTYFQEGDVVKLGDIVAKSGSSSETKDVNGYTPHLHLGIVSCCQDDKENIVSGTSSFESTSIYGWKLTPISSLYRDPFNHNSQPPKGKTPR